MGALRKADSKAKSVADDAIASASDVALARNLPVTTFAFVATVPLLFPHHTHEGAYQSHYSAVALRIKGLALDGIAIRECGRVAPKTRHNPRDGLEAGCRAILY